MFALPGCLARRTRNGWERRYDSGARSGFTLTELIVAVSVVGLLLALILPAVQQSRGAGRQLQCQDHLRQIGIALANREASLGAFPTNADGYVQILPAIEQSSAYQIAQAPGMQPLPLIELLLCPNETYPIEPLYGQVPSYRFNSGTLFPSRMGDGLNGFRTARRAQIVRGEIKFRGTTVAEITDGLSNTAAISERLITRGGRNYLGEVSPETLQSERLRFPWTTERAVSGDDATGAAISQCTEHRVAPTFVDGITPSVRSADVGYDHLLPPNHVACLNGPTSDEVIHRDYAIIPASSLHPGGVNVVFADQHVQFVAESIDRGVWQSVGTRNGGELDGIHAL
jgi:prepilin-type N-terminal cleavage/methylation domain-containing protein/prepilin-type processing-associated H-X9-DG protein